MIGHIYYFFWDRVPEAMIEPARWVGNFTDSDAAEIGAIFLLLPVSVAITGFGLILTTVALGPLLVVYTLAALAWAGIRAAHRKIRNGKEDAA